MKKGLHSGDNDTRSQLLKYFCSRSDTGSHLFNKKTETPRNHQHKPDHEKPVTFPAGLLPLCRSLRPPDTGIGQMRRKADGRRDRNRRLYVRAKRRAGHIHARCRRPGAVHQSGDPVRLPGSARWGHPAILPRIRPGGQTLRLRIATVARLGRMLRTAGDRRSAAQDRRAFPAVAERGHARIAGGNR